MHQTRFDASIMFQARTVVELLSQTLCRVPNQRFFPPDFNEMGCKGYGTRPGRHAAEERGDTLQRRLATEGPGDTPRRQVRAARAVTT